ncbi:MAG TPA: hypothetical protein VHJ17_24965 [Thermomonospora sp.]|nr:hypothetical protein [Thermomonospora sp.]
MTGTLTLHFDGDDVSEVSKVEVDELKDKVVVEVRLRRTTGDDPVAGVRPAHEADHHPETAPRQPHPHNPGRLDDPDRQTPLTERHPARRESPAGRLVHSPPFQTA